MLVCSACHNGLVEDVPRCLHCGAFRPRDGWEVEALEGALLLGRYVVERRLGAGATGVVYRACDRRAAPGAAARVAVKFLHRDQLGDPRLVARFRREALAASQIDHPGVARSFAFGDHEGAVFLVMEYVEGVSLETRLRATGPLNPGRAAAVGAEIALALAAAHAQGVIHRDLKPANIWLVPAADGRDTVKVLDFGYALIESPERGFMRVTRTGFLVGSPAYMSPEQTLVGGAVDARTDVYALGVVLYRVLTGRRPFVAPTLVEQIRLHRQARPEGLRDAAPERAIPRPLERLVLRLLEKDPRRRPPAAEAAAALRALRLPDDPPAVDAPADPPPLPDAVAPAAPAPTAAESSSGGRARIVAFLRSFTGSRPPRA